MHYTRREKQVCVGLNEKVARRMCVYVKELCHFVIGTRCIGKIHICSEIEFDQRMNLI